MGEFQVLSLEPDLIPNVILAQDDSVSFCSFIDGFGGLIPVFHQFSDPFFH